MQANAKTLGDVRPSAAVSGPGQQRATQERNEGTNENGSFYTSIGVGIQKGLLSWLAATVTDEREKRTCREGKQTAGMDGWMDEWMTLEIGRR